MNIKSMAVKYAVFLAMVALTTAVVRPAIQRAQIPFLKDVI